MIINSEHVSTSDVSKSQFAATQVDIYIKVRE